MTDQYTGPTDLASGQTNPDDLFPRALTANAVYVDGGTRVRGLDGPGKRGDEFDIDTRYDYSKDRMFPAIEPTPRRGWRSTGDGSAANIPLVFDTTLLGTGGQESNPGSDVFCLYLDGINWHTGIIQGYTAGAWSTIGTFDTADGLNGLGWAREGNRIVPAVGGTDKPFIHANEFAGARFEINATTIRKITRHGDGTFNKDATYQTARLLLESPAAVDPSGGTSGAIWPRRCALIVNVAGATYSGFRLVIDAQDTLEEYFEIGTLSWGPVYVTAPFPDQGVQRGIQHGGTLATARDRTTTSRIDAPSARTLTMAWSDSSWEGEVQGDTPTPNHINAYTGASAEPVASWGAAHRTLEGVVSMLDDSLVPVVALPRIPITGDKVVVLNRQQDFLYGWMSGPVTRSVVFGQRAGRDDLVTGGTITFAEQV